MIKQRTIEELKQLEKSLAEKYRDPHVCSFILQKIEGIIIDNVLNEDKKNLWINRLWSINEQFFKSYLPNIKGDGVPHIQNIIWLLEDEINNSKINAEILETERVNYFLQCIFSRFHSIVKQMKSRHNHRDTLDVSDEYDVQDLLHCLLKIVFDDIRREETTPSHAGKSARMDFLIKDFKLVIEVKMTRIGLGEKEICDQLLVDIARYQNHDDCKTLICFIYDPEGRISNPKGIENDFNKKSGDLTIRLLINP